MKTYSQEEARTLRSPETASKASDLNEEDSDFSFNNLFDFSNKGGETNLHFKSGTPSSIVISNVLGQEVGTIPNNGKIINYDASDLTDGVYFITVTYDDGSVQTKKAVVSKEDGLTAWTLSFDDKGQKSSGGTTPGTAEENPVVHAGGNFNRVELLDLTGQTRADVSASNNKAVLDRGKLPNGIYFVMIYLADGKKISKKIIISDETTTITIEK